MDSSNIEIAKSLAEAHLSSVFDKYLVIGFNVENGIDTVCNCDSEQLRLLLLLFQQMLVGSESSDTQSNTDSLN